MDLQDERQHYTTTKRPYTHLLRLTTRLFRRQDQPFQSSFIHFVHCRLDSNSLYITFLTLDYPPSSPTNTNITALLQIPSSIVTIYHHLNKLRSTSTSPSIVYSLHHSTASFRISSSFSSSCDPTLRNKLIPWVNSTMLHLFQRYLNQCSDWRQKKRPFFIVDHFFFLLFLLCSGGEGYLPFTSMNKRRALSSSIFFLSMMVVGWAVGEGILLCVSRRRFTIS